MEVEDFEPPYSDPCCYKHATLFQRMTWFIVCPICGNKRCPKATDHELECSGSNEPGQKGSRYE